MKIAVNELFGPTIQGEGRRTGRPSIFLRLNGCNLRCAFAGSICDSAYSSWNAEKNEPIEQDVLVGQVVELFKANSNVHDLVVTGGEPLLQQIILAQVIKQIKWETDCFVTVETNGSITPCDKMLEVVNLWSVSPKLANSCHFEGTDISEAAMKRHMESRINLRAVYSMMQFGNDGQLKFVYSANDEKCREYIESYVNDLMESCNGLMDDLVNSGSWQIQLMPEGETPAQISASAEAAVQVCIENGWRFCDRVHIRIWGDKRAV